MVGVGLMRDIALVISKTFPAAPPGGAARALARDAGKGRVGVGGGGGDAVGKAQERGRESECGVMGLSENVRGRERVESEGGGGQGGGRGEREGQAKTYGKRTDSVGRKTHSVRREHVLYRIYSLTR